MIPNFVTPPNSVDTQVFSPKLTLTARTDGVAWTKPPGTSMVWVWAVGNGAPGGGGNAGGLVNNAGGVGGQGGAFLNCVMPAMFFPDSVLINFTGSPSGMALQDATTRATILNFDLSATTTSITNSYMFNGWYYSRNGGGGANAAPSSAVGINASVGSFFNAGGAGGGGTNATGGAVPSILGYPALTSAPVSTVGQSGYNFQGPLAIFYPGAGGAGSSGNYTVQADGAGGKGGIGCGGGGGGGDTTGAAGLGGAGGDPLVIIMSW